jgi:hypothetical protein
MECKDSKKDDALSFYLKALQLEADGFLDEAVANYKKAFRLDPS